MKRILLVVTIAMLALSLGWAHPAQATTPCRIYVSASATPGGKGLLWETAYQNLQDGIDAANVARGGYENTCDVWVAQGEYAPKNSGDNFSWPDFVNIYGGFAGNESDLSARHWKVHPSILEGNHARVIYAYGVYHATLDGFTITGGDATVWSPQLGGGIYSYCGSPNLINLIFSGNKATYGGGLAVSNYGCSYTYYYPSLFDVVFTGNTASSGGGMLNMGANTHLVNVAFSGNSATQGDGIYNLQSSPNMLNVTMDGNGIYNYNHSTPTINNSILWGSSAEIINEESTSLPASISYSLVEGCKPGGVWQTPCGADGDHNLTDTDPEFVSPTDMHLQVDSPVIDQGSNALIPSYITSTDLDGNPRIMGSAVDLGAYEYQPARRPIYLPLIQR